jgi:FdhD protein
LDNEPLEISDDIKILKVFSTGERQDLMDSVPLEILLTIELNDKHRVTLSCSPSSLIHLAVGYLVNNGYISRYGDLDTVRLCEQEKKEGLFRRIISATSKKAEEGLEGERPKYISSACGGLDDMILEKSLKKNRGLKRFSYNSVMKLNSLTLKSQRCKKGCGGLHSAALFDDNAGMLYLSEDIGRHNCVDKTAGYALMNRIGAHDKVLFTTGRISIDLIYKASVMGIPMLVSNSSVTHSAARAAEKLNITVIGYARGRRFNIYSCPWRIVN